MWQRKRWKKVPLLSTWMRFVYCLFLDRENPKEGLKTILQAIDYVKNGISICIFPEGTRNKGEELSLLPFKEGAFKIATKTGCPIVPISMNNTAEISKSFPRSRNNMLFSNTVLRSIQMNWIRMSKTYRKLCREYC